MKNYNTFKYLFLISWTVVFSSEKFIDDFSNDWIELQNKSIHISWQQSNETQFCKASIVYDHPSKKIKALLENQEDYPHIFDRIIYSKIIKNDIVHIKLDLPFPFYGRDYIVKYKYIKIGEIEYFIYKATTEVNIPKEENYVRLINAEGLWKINPLNKNQTEVTYIWNGELLGDFPDWALTTAWTEQGNEVLTWLKEALE